jgi:kinesin family protein 2/24
MESKLNYRQSPVIEKQEYDVDHAFGPNDDNDKVYNQIALSCVDLSLQGGLSSIFAYGQTGSGKTFTIQGILKNLAEDIFKRQTGIMLDEENKSRLSIFVSFFQILGNDT